MTDYTKLVKALRDTERVCRDRMDGQVMLDAADAIEELNKNWKYCSDMLNLALKVSGLSMTALVKLYETEVQDA